MTLPSVLVLGRLFGLLEKKLDEKVGEPGKKVVYTGSTRSERSYGVVKGDAIASRGAMPARGSKALWGSHQYLSEDDRGHLIGHQFGGAPGSENLLPMNRQVNQSGAYKKFENAVAKLFGDRKKEKRAARLYMDVTPVYPDGKSFRPTKNRLLATVHWLEKRGRVSRRFEYSDLALAPNRANWTGCSAISWRSHRRLHGNDASRLMSSAQPVSPANMRLGAGAERSAARPRCSRSFTSFELGRRSGHRRG